MMKRWLSGFVIGILVAWIGPLLTGAQPMQVAIDTNKTSEPISKYVYGQFIEHLGRCIYGGIWAEMLEDRKFYFPVKDEFKPWSTATDRDHWNGGDFPVLTGSPWKVLGGRNVIHMMKENVFVGEHTPQIQLKGDGTFCGIEQGELALEEGRDYIGYVIAAGEESASPLWVRLIWGDTEEESQTVRIDSIVPAYTKYPFTFTAQASTAKGRLQIGSAGKGVVFIGTASLMPADNIQGFRADTMALLKELDSPVYRWPGGNFVSDYNWKDGIGDRDKRPPRKNPAWTGIESNDVGIHEFMEFCTLLSTEPYIAVNTGKGSIEAAAEEVQYCNGSPETPMGKWRAENGHPEPYNVKWWAVGNEMYGSWQHGHMPLEDYVKKHNDCVTAMRAADPSIQMVAVGNVGEWSRTMMTHCADAMDLISEHIYCKNKDNLVEHAAQLAHEIKRVADAHREYRKTLPSLNGKDIRIAMDEWNYWYGQYIYGELGCQYFLQDGLGVAAGLHEYFRNSDLYFMANYAQTVNVIGAIKTTGTRAWLETTGQVLKLYREHFGVTPAAVSHDVDGLDVAAAWTADRSALTIAAVNANGDPVAIDLAVAGFALPETLDGWTIQHGDPEAYNDEHNPDNVAIRPVTVTRTEGRIELAPYSVTLLRVPAGA